MTPTLFSVSYAGLWGQARLDLKAFIRKAAGLGYGAVELMAKRPHLSVVDTDRRTLRALKKTAEAAGVEIATIAGYTNFCSDRAAPEVPFVEMQVAYVNTLAEMAAELGAKAVRVFTGYSSEEAACQSDWRVCVAAVRECAEVASRHGVALGVQNHHDVGVGLDAYLAFLDEVDHPNCRAMFDPWSVGIQGEDLYACAKALAPRMVQTTLADYIRLKRFAYMPGLVNYSELPAMLRAVPLGQGFLDLPAFMRGLRDGGFDGYAAYEMCSPLRGGGSMENLDRAAAESLERIREWTA